MGRYLDTKEHKDWSKAVRAGGCIIGDNCSKKLDAHHLIPKANIKYRSDPKNGICLCARHHSKYGSMISPHSENSAGFFIWLIKNRPDIWNWLVKHADTTR